MPEGLKAAQKDIAKFNLNRKRALAQGIIIPAVATAVAKSFISKGPSASVLLATVENTMVDALAKLYGIDANSNTVLFIKNNIANGTVNKIAKTAIATVQSLPVGQKLGIKIIGPLISACVVIIIGESATHAFEKIYLGDEEHNIINKIKEFFESDFTTQIIEQAKAISAALTATSGPKEITQAATSFYKTKSSKK